MADKIKEEKPSLSSDNVVPSTTSEEVQTLETTDDFDPFSGVVECGEENIDVVLSAPPERQWYHGRLDRNKAEDRLRQNTKLGSYLIRESDRKPGSYVLSYLGQTGINHFRITAMCGDYYIGGREFDTLSDLIGYYTSWSDLLKSERLHHPIPPPEPVYDKRKVIAILPYSQMPDTDELSFEKGEIFVVHNDMGDGWLWVTSQSTGLSGIVNQELVQELNGNIDPVESNEWYHPEISKEIAANKLESAGPGSWLVRPSDTTSGDYTLFYYCNRNIQRFKIQKHSRQYFMGGRYFDSIAGIVERYKREQIVDGFTLGKPVLRPRSNVLQDDNSSLGSRNGRDIYSTMRQSSGSNFFLNRKDTIVIKGFLNKKSQRTKKWKYMYFVLNGTEQQLYYFENQKRSKPKGLIDLSYSSIYPVHDSFFGRPNCFQLVMRALNHVSVSYICADNCDQALAWTQALKGYCTNTQPRKTPRSHLPTVTELRSLHLKVFSAQKLPAKPVYCVLSLNEVKVARTQVKEGPQPPWDEEFLLDDIPPDILSFTLSVYNKGKRSKDTEIVKTMVILSELKPGEELDSWKCLVSPNTTSRSEASSIRISTRFLHEIIMPSKEYTVLKELLSSKDLEVIQTLTEVSTSGNHRVPLAVALLQIFRYERLEAHLLQTLNNLEMDKEVEESGTTSTLFRSTSWATTMMDQYMKMAATSFVHQAVQGIINKIVESKQSCELNPANLISSQDAEANAKQLIAILNEAVNTIFKSTDSCPMVLRYICGCLQRKAKSLWPNDSLVKTRVVSGFIFLRLLCCAIVNPKTFNLVTESPSHMAARTLMLVANSLIKLASLTEIKEPHMEVVNVFIRENKQRLIMFLDELSNVPDFSAGQCDVPAIDISRSLATVHQICVMQFSELQKLQDPSRPSVKRLVTVTEMLTNHKKHYLGNT